MTGANLHIERIVVHGLPGTRGHEAALGEVVAAELTRLLREEGVPPGLDAGGAVSRLAPPPVRVTPGAGAGALGLDVARSVYGSLGAVPGGPAGEHG